MLEEPSSFDSLPGSIIATGSFHAGLFAGTKNAQEASPHNSRLGPRNIGPTGSHEVTRGPLASLQSKLIYCLVTFHAAVPRSSMRVLFNNLSRGQRNRAENGAFDRIFCLSTAFNRLRPPSTANKAASPQNEDADRQ